MDLEHLFKYHPPQGDEDVLAYQAIRNAGRHLAGIILEHTPECADQSAAIRKVREAVFTANAARALGGKGT